MATEKEKCRETKVVRVKGENGSWVDLEVLENASFKGAQWEGLDVGNRPQETIFVFRRSENEDRGGDGSKVKLIPDAGGHFALIQNYESALFETRKGRVRLVMRNETKNCKRNKKDLRRRIQFNQVDDEFMEGGTPPSRPKEYMKAVELSKDTSEIWLDTFEPAEVSFYRNKDINHQHILFKDLWGGEVNMPHASKETDKKNTHVRLDPFQVVVNFGPDGMAVQFFDGED